MNLTFICPECGCTEIEEVCQAEFAISPVSKIEIKGGITNLEYGPLAIVGDVHYQCVECGEALETADGSKVCDKEGLSAWLLAAVLQYHEKE